MAPAVSGLISLARGWGTPLEGQAPTEGGSCSSSRRRSSSCHTEESAAGSAAGSKARGTARSKAAGSSRPMAPRENPAFSLRSARPGWSSLDHLLQEQKKPSSPLRPPPRPNWPLGAPPLQEEQQQRQHKQHKQQQQQQQQQQRQHTQQRQQQQEQEEDDEEQPRGQQRARRLKPSAPSMPFMLLLLLLFCSILLPERVESCSMLQVQASTRGKTLTKPREFQLSGYKNDRPMWQYSGPMGIEKFYIMWQGGLWIVYGSKGKGAIVKSDALSPQNVTDAYWTVFDAKNGESLDPDFKIRCPKSFSLANLDPLIVKGMDPDLKKQIENPKMQAQFRDLSVYLKVLGGEDPPADVEGIYIRVLCSLSEICLAKGSTLLAFDAVVKAWVLARGEFVLAVARLETDNEEVQGGITTTLADLDLELEWRQRYNESDPEAVEPPPFTAKFLRPAVFQASCGDECKREIEAKCTNHESPGLCKAQFGYPPSPPPPKPEVPTPEPPTETPPPAGKTKAEKQRKEEKDESNKAEGKQQQKVEQNKNLQQQQKSTEKDGKPRGDANSAEKDEL